jgi:hypothetical protein
LVATGSSARFGFALVGFVAVNCDADLALPREHHRIVCSYEVRYGPFDYGMAAAEVDGATKVALQIAEELSTVEKLN